MHYLTIQTGIILFIAAGACAIEEADVKALVSESLYISEQCKKAEEEMKAATSSLDEQLKPIEEEIILFKRPTLNEGQISRIKGKITFARNQIAQKEALIESANITDPTERSKLANKCQAEMERLLAEEKNAERLLIGEAEQLRQEVKDKQGPFEKAMKSYCLLPQSKYPAVTNTYASALYHTGSLTYKWMDANSKQLASANISLKDKPFILYSVKTYDVLDGTYYMSELWTNKIVVWAGNFRVSLDVAEPRWFGREKITELVKDFVDLEGLAKIDPSRDDNSLNTMAKGSLACSKRYSIIQNEKEDTTNKIASERMKVKALRSSLRGRPVDSEQLNKEKELIDYYKKEIKQNQTLLDIGTVTDPNERTARITKLEAEKNRLDTEKVEISKQYYDRIYELTIEHEQKETALNYAIKKYLLTEIDAYPEVEQITTVTKFNMGSIDCIWRDALGRELCSAQLSLGKKPDVPEDAQMLDGLYYISDSGSNFIRVWAGSFQVYFEMKKRQWQGQENISETIKHFIDLAGLAKIS